jgi:hypothetical protein
VRSRRKFSEVIKKVTNAVEKVYDLHGKNLLSALSKELSLICSKKNNDEKVYGCENLSFALNIYSKTKKKESDKKRFLRTAKRCDFPVYRENRRIYMFKKDIDEINNFYLFNYKQMSVYCGVHIRTFYKWLKLKRYSKMPVDKKRKIVDIRDLNLWYTILLFERTYRGRSVKKFLKPKAPIVIGVLSELTHMTSLGLSHPRELKRYKIQRIL